MAAEVTYDAASARLTLATSSHLTAEFSEILRDWEIGFTSVKRTRFLNEAEEMLLPHGPVIVDLDAEQVRSGLGNTASLLKKRSEKNRIVTVLDAALLDEIAPLLDVPELQLLVWPGEREALMAALQPIDLSNRVAEQLRADGEVDIEHLRGEVERIAHALSTLVTTPPPVAADAKGGARTGRQSATLLRRLIQQRRVRADFFPGELFADPAWDILLDLAAARHEKKPVSISSLCIAAAVPTTTGLRWIKALTEANLLQRMADPEDGRRSFITLSDRTAAAMEAYLDAVA